MVSDGSSAFDVCHVCREPAPRRVAGFGRLPRVTSDCKPWGPGGALAVCRACGCVQKVVDAGWRAEAAAVYDGYSLYYQSDGAEQAVFDPGSGAGAPRSDRLLGHLRSAYDLPYTGRLLDVGCGNGAFLRAFARTLPGWRLSGTEQTDRTRAIVETIPGFESFHTGALDALADGFDLVSLVHVLEHVPRPGELLRALAGKIAPGGRLLVQVPDSAQNPFDLLVVDHATHFTPATLRAVVGACGYEVQTVDEAWVAKEISLVARPAAAPAVPASAEGPEPYEFAEAAVGWLGGVLAKARSLAARGAFGVFGTSIAAMWLLGDLGDRIAFFVDEDPGRLGKTLFGRPVYHPGEAPAGSDVFVALPTPLATAVQDRLRPHAAVFHLPPDLPALQHA